MPTWASADRTVQRGCEPKAINPLQGEKRERGRFLAAAILAQNGIFSISTRWKHPPEAPAGSTRRKYPLDDPERPSPSGRSGVAAIHFVRIAPAWRRARAKFRQNPAPRSAK